MTAIFRNWRPEESEWWYELINAAIVEIRTVNSEYNIKIAIIEVMIKVKAEGIVLNMEMDKVDV